MRGGSYWAQASIPNSLHTTEACGRPRPGFDEPTYEQAIQDCSRRALQEPRSSLQRTETLVKVRMVFFVWGGGA